MIDKTEVLVELLLNPTMKNPDIEVIIAEFRRLQDALKKSQFETMFEADKNLAKELEISELIVMVKDLKETVEAFNEQAAKIDEENLGLKNKLKRKQDEINIVEKKCNSIDKHFKDLYTINESLLKQRDDKKNEIALLDDLLNQMALEMDDSKRTVEKLVEDNAKLSDDLKKWQRGYADEYVENMQKDQW